MHKEHPEAIAVLTYDDLLTAQVAAEDAVLAKGAEVWSVADPEAMTVTLHLERPMDKTGY
jgi:hypothetical protein